MADLEKVSPWDYEGKEGKYGKNRDLSFDQHDRKIEWAALIGTGGVIILSFSSLAAAAFVPSISPVEKGKAIEQLVSFASGAGTTALGALVAVLARKRRSTD